MKSTLDIIAHKILKSPRDRHFIVGVNGVDGSGKTEFVKNLAAALEQKTQRQIVTISIDGFHNPKSIRYAKGRRSAEGFYRDSFNLQAFEEQVLRPLKNGEGECVARIFDVGTDTTISDKRVIASTDAIILIEGIFLFQNHLLPYFDLKIFLDVPFEETLRRMLVRDNGSKSQQDAVDLFETRYKAGQQLYFSEVHPKKVANIVIDNTDYNAPKIVLI